MRDEVIDLPDLECLLSAIKLFYCICQLKKRPRPSQAASSVVTANIYLVTFISSDLLYEVHALSHNSSGCSSVPVLPTRTARFSIEQQIIKLLLVLKRKSRGPAYPSRYCQRLLPTLLCGERVEVSIPGGARGWRRN